jgi:hypothetical protein
MPMLCGRRWIFRTDIMGQRTNALWMGAHVVIGSATALIVPFTPFAEIFGFSPLPTVSFLLIGVIVLLYVIAAEITKTVFCKKVKF